MRSLCLDLASAEDHLPLCVDLAEETWEDEEFMSGSFSRRSSATLCRPCKETWEDEEFMSGLSFCRRSSATLCRPCRGDMGG